MLYIEICLKTVQFILVMSIETVHQLLYAARKETDDSIKAESKQCCERPQSWRELQSSSLCHTSHSWNQLINRWRKNIRTCGGNLHFKCNNERIFTQTPKTNKENSVWTWKYLFFFKPTSPQFTAFVGFVREEQLTTALTSEMVWVVSSVTQATSALKIS